MGQWRSGDPVTGERLQALAEVSVVTPSILAFHRSLRHAGVQRIAPFSGTHTELEPSAEALAALAGRSPIFVYSHLLDSFVARVLPRLQHRFVLISHNSDAGVDARFVSALDDERIAHWFAQNTLIRHPKLSPLPIGLANAQWAHGQVDALVGVANAPPAPRREVVYVNFEVRTNPALRAPLRERLLAQPLAWHAPVRPFAQYLADMRSCRWVLSPPGNGVDCHRTWEALYLGTVPIVQHSEAGAVLHDGLPVIQLADLGVLDRDRIEQLERGLPPHDAVRERITMDHWRRRIGERVAAARAGA